MPEELYSVHCTEKEHFGSDSRYVRGAALVSLAEATAHCEELNSRALAESRSCKYEPRKQSDRPVLTRSEAGFILMHSLMGGFGPPDFTHADIVDENSMDANLGFTA